LSKRKQGRAFWSDEEEKLDKNFEKLGSASSSFRERKGFAYWIRPIVFAAMFVYVASTIYEIYQNEGAIPRRGVLKVQPAQPRF
jgi:hypothetical protein